MRGSAVVLGVRRVANLPDRWKADEPEWPTLRLAGAAGRKERSMPWTYYDAAGKPVPEKAATFRCREVSVDGSAPAPPSHGSLGAIEYHDVHAIDQPGLRKTFKSFSKMKAWFKEHASKTKGQAR
jgi:hypothetical protein